MEWPTIKEVVEALRAVRNDLKRNHEQNQGREQREDTYCDVRLQVMPLGQWALRTGDSSYDTDHNGHWGGASVSWGDSLVNLRRTAKDLIEQCQDSFAESQ